MNTEKRQSRKITKNSTGDGPGHLSARMVDGVLVSKNESGTEASRTLCIPSGECQGGHSPDTKVETSTWREPFLKVKVVSSRQKRSTSRYVFVGFFVFITVFFYSLSALAVYQSDASPEEREAARGIEAMLAKHLIEEMRKSVPENEYVPKSQAERIFENLLDEEYARKMSESNMLGISDLVLAQIKSRR